MVESTARTEVGSVFVSNYPPYSVWSPQHLDAVRQVLQKAAAQETTLGLYLHIPFCRRRCKFCYFKVYVEKDSKEVQRYLEGLSREVEMLAALAAVQGRALRFVYFGGGTPSFISAKHLSGLVQRVKEVLPWDAAEEVTFECEPGTLTEAKLETIRDIGVTRLSLGVESFDDGILAENGRAHLAEEIFRCLPWIRGLSFPQLNIDLIAGMVGETWDTWRDSVQKTIDLDPDSVTIYQMELPYNTVYSHDLLQGEGVPVAGWDQKREWHDHAIQALEDAGYRISSAYTMVKQDGGGAFVYRDALWHGGDMLGSGVASFSTIQGVHYQNHSSWEPYLEAVDRGVLPLERAFVTGPEDRLIREVILQLKLGRLDPGSFKAKFGVDILEHFRQAFRRLQDRKMLQLQPQGVQLTRQGLLQVDSLLPEFYAPAYRNVRYT